MDNNGTDDLAVSIKNTFTQPICSVMCPILWIRDKISDLKKPTLVS
jgi:hypothetical protein